MKITNTKIEGLLIIEPRFFPDKRGFFMETYHQKRYSEAGIDIRFVQDNLSHSIKGTLRGLHYQIKHTQAKFVQVIRGIVFDVAVDIRRGSPTFGNWTGVYLTDENKRQVFIPEGCAHGFCVMSETADIIYKCTDFYSPEDERGILWSDPEIGIDWPVTDPVLSEKDSRNPSLSDITPENLPLFKGMH